MIAVSIAFTARIKARPGAKSPAQRRRTRGARALPHSALAALGTSALGTSALSALGTSFAQ
jgi:hypothetical protein